MIVEIKMTSSNCHTKSVITDPLTPDQPIVQAHTKNTPGLAVSGGADSMCLAYLCKQLEKLGVHGSISATAFVVDHKARSESNREAKTVAGWLRDMGMHFLNYLLVSHEALAFIIND